MATAYNKDLQRQVDLLEKVLRGNAVVQDVLKLAPKLEIPDWYLGAGCLAQSVWNHFHGFEPAHGIKDCDLVYYDSSDSSAEAEETKVQKAKEIFRHLSLPVEVKNQARVHLWYGKRFGREITAYDSVEAAINEWPTTATGIGVRYDKTEALLSLPPMA